MDALRSEGIATWFDLGLMLDRLRDVVDAEMQGNQQRMTLSLPAQNGKALRFLERFADILDRQFADGRAILDVRIPPRALDHLHSLAKDVRHVEA